MRSHVRLRRIESGVYETLDGKFRAVRWDGNGGSWGIAERDGAEWVHRCEVRTLADVRLLLSGGKGLVVS